MTFLPVLPTVTVGATIRCATQRRRQASRPTSQSGPEDSRKMTASIRLRHPHYKPTVRRFHGPLCRHVMGLPKLDVAGSSPVSRSMFSMTYDLPATFQVP
jgi:hypothetical protein